MDLDKCIMTYPPRMLSLAPSPLCLLVSFDSFSTSSLFTPADSVHCGEGHGQKRPAWARAGSSLAQPKPGSATIITKKNKSRLSDPHHAWKVGSRVSPSFHLRDTGQQAVGQL